MSEPSRELALLRELRQRRMGREGIPMVLVLTDERDAAAAPQTATEPATGSDGGRLADRLTGLAAALAPGQRPDDIALVETLIQVLSYEDFNDVIQP